MTNPRDTSYSASIPSSGSRRHPPIGVPSVVGEPDADPGPVPESLIHEIWRLQEFRFDDLQTVLGDRLVVLHPGRINANQGPDFLDARLIVGATTWVGSIEIHRTSSEWYGHRHHLDPLYDSVVLHVTLAADRNTGKLRRSDGTSIPEIVIAPRLREPIEKLHRRFRKGGKLFFACEDLWPSVPDPIIAAFLRELARARIERKAGRIEDRFLKHPDLNQILYEETCRCLGYSQNGEAMVLLSRRVPLSLLAQFSDPRDRAALLLATAGLICRKWPHGAENPWGDLERRYRDWSQISLPDRLPLTIWRHARLRPANFPEQRILQCAALFGPGSPLDVTPLDRLLEQCGSVDPAKRLVEILSIPQDVAVYLSIDGDAPLRLGRDRRITVVANAILPILTTIAEQSNHDKMPDAIDVLGNLPVVIDHVVRRYSAKRGRPSSAAITQGLHELSRSWCGQGRCRECPIWREIARINP